ncbi:hypothetical protein ACFE04_014300 [Oxalis oulophora]
MAAFPEDIIFDVLVNLPILSLLRFGCVSKSWYALIFGPDFFQYYGRKRLYQDCFTEQTLVKVRKENGFRLVKDFGFTIEPNNIYSPLNEQKQAHFMRSIIVGSCNGLICLVSFPWDCDVRIFIKFVIWNPFTRQYKELPVLPKHDGKPEAPLSDYIYGFGFDSSSDDYKLIMASYNVTKHNSQITTINIYSMRNNVWRKVELGEQEIDFIMISKKSTLCNGALHWFVKKEKQANMNRVLAFDLYEEKFRDFKLPMSFEADDYLPILGVLNGCLTMCFRRDIPDGYHNIEIENNIEIEIWTMKDYGEAESWFKVEYREMRQGRWRGGISNPICFHQQDRNTLIWGEFINNEYWCCIGSLPFDDHNIIDCVFYEETLLSPDLI